jgi:hypothetical protein
MRYAIADMQTPSMVVAILGASYIEAQLERMIRPRVFRKSDDDWSKLTSENGPFSTFHQKILMGYALGFYDVKIMDALKRVKSIRNAFAHGKRIFSFDHESVRHELKSVPLSGSPRSALHKRLKIVRSVQSDGRIPYVILCLSLMLELGMREQRAMKRRAKRRGRAEKTLPANPLVTALQGWKGSGLGMMPQIQNDDPTSQGLGAGLTAYQRERLAASRNKKD